jgi:hypothetical protein
MIQIDINLQYETTTTEDLQVVSSWNDDTKVVIFSGQIDSDTDKDVIRFLEEEAVGERLLFIITTPGGDADAAYKIARYCKSAYKLFSLGVFSECKSAGTLLALGAQELIISKKGELGPLDVQMYRPDEFMQLSSGLNISQALDYLSEKTFESWESIFLQIRQHSQGVITTKTAAEIACSIVTGLYSPISSKIDPQSFGEMQRSLRIATEYGKRLGVKESVVEHLCKNYPAHSFVIDLQEAKDLLGDIVREPTAFEEMIICNVSEKLIKDYKINPIKRVIRAGFLGSVKIKIDNKLEYSEINGEIKNENTIDGIKSNSSQTDTTGSSSGTALPKKTPRKSKIKNA